MQIWATGTIKFLSQQLEKAIPSKETNHCRACLRVQQDTLNVAVWTLFKRFNLQPVTVYRWSTSEIIIKFHMVFFKSTSFTW